MDEKLLNSLYKKALGYTAKEQTLEYSPEGELIKKKVTTKHYPPDISALKAYLEMADEGYRKMTDEELEEEKTRLLRLLKENEDGINDD